MSVNFERILYTSFSVVLIIDCWFWTSRCQLRSAVNVHLPNLKEIQVSLKKLVICILLTACCICSSYFKPLIQQISYRYCWSVKPSFGFSFFFSPGLSKIFSRPRNICNNFQVWNLIQVEQMTRWNKEI